MSAHDQMRAMLDQLMGTSRNVLGEWREGRRARRGMAEAEVAGRGRGKSDCAALFTPPWFPRPSHHRGLMDRGDRCVAPPAGCWCSCSGGTRAPPLWGTGSESKVAPRDGDDTTYRLKFTDPKVCKSFLLTCCPHEILSSTRMDLGECPKVHDLALRADYEQATKTKDYYYDIDAMEHLQSFITDCDRRTESAKKRLAETQEELSAEVAAKANKVHDLAEQIGKKLARAESLGADGMVERSGTCCISPYLRVSLWHKFTLAKVTRKYIATALSTYYVYLDDYL
ncbi:putative RNA-binding protein Luc7-like 2 [Portunus trituberculatus]|uniref:Putative RNA-binding protein Luc7-like 2 n=1 Tax=Portunus trituberculatus TaxID=210409 RepID=A0A5B7D9E5_PORTR|nr:putative RNA-binding protein Luc7-like 2 [Portunus trituberculatus]